MADQGNGGQGNDPLYPCFPVGMPRVMNAVFPMDIVITPKATEDRTATLRAFTAAGRCFGGLASILYGIS